MAQLHRLASREGQHQRESLVVGRPKSIPRLPFVARKQLTFEVKPHAADRLAFKIGPQKFVEGDWPVLYHIQMSLQHDGTAQPMRVGSAILVGSLVEELESYFSNYGGVVTKSDDCVLSNAKLVQEFAKLPGASPPPSSDYLRPRELLRRREEPWTAAEGYTWRSSAWSGTAQP